VSAAAVTGLAAEARIAHRAGLPALAAGGLAVATAAAITQLIAGGASGLVSFGICGALDEGLDSGTLILPRVVCDEAGASYPVAEAWQGRVSARLRSAGLPPVVGTMLGASRIARTPAEKAVLHRSTGAIAVDLESHLVAQMAVAAALPFIVLRSVADAATRELPTAVLVGLDAQGRPALWPVLRAVARQPREIPALLRAALDTRRALHALRYAVARIGESLRDPAAE
jgi:adenosylhomocysteine nucleosidase